MTNHTMSRGSVEEPLVAVVIVNWNRPGDTIECLNSVFSGSYENYFVIVSDNGSDDCSVQRISKWASGGDLSSRRTLLPVNHEIIGSSEIVNGAARSGSCKLTLIELAENAGFAAAANRGITLAMRNPAVRYIWLLNNDTVVSQHCLRVMVSRMMDDGAATMCGSRLVNYYCPTEIEALGGARFYRLIGESRKIRKAHISRNVINNSDIERRIHHLVGASMLVSRSFVGTVGLMSEEYFMYYEEIDWTLRARRRCKILYAHEAVVMHKSGASFGGGDNICDQSARSAYFLTSSRLRFTKKFFWWALPTVLAFSVVQTLRALIKGNQIAAVAMLNGILAGLVGKPQSIMRERKRRFHGENRSA